MLDDISYIEDIHHYSGKMGLVVWHQYDVLLATRPYGWDTMVKYVAYLAQADIKKVETLTTSDLAGGTDTELIDDYRRSDGDLYRVLAEERGTLGVGGYSYTLKGSVKVVWYNQTRVLRIDWGFALHAPYKTEYKGYFNMRKFSDMQTINFAVGYPF